MIIAYNDGKCYQKGHVLVLNLLCYDVAVWRLTLTGWRPWFMVYVLTSNCSWYYPMVICRRMQWSCFRLSNMAGLWRPCRGAVIKPTMPCLDSVLRLKRLLIRVRMHCKNWVSMADVICTTSCHFGLAVWFNWGDISSSLQCIRMQAQMPCI